MEVQFRRVMQTKRYAKRYECTDRQINGREAIYMMIKLDNISKYYYSSNAVVPALRKIKLEFDTGEFVAITGESGSGKSTLLNIISGLDTYDDGELYVDGKETSYYDAADWEQYRKNEIGFIFQNYNLIEHYSVINNVESALLIQGYSTKKAKSIAKKLIHRVGLGKQLHQRASRLSSGQKQRLSIARALAKNTNIIIADEPTGNLDSENGRQIMELLAEIAKDKLIIIVTHNYEEAAPYVTRRIRLHDGEVVADDYIKQEDNRKHAAEPDKGLGQPTKQEEAFDEPVTEKKANRRIAWRFTLMNILTQPRRVALFMLLLLITSAASFLFLGQIYSNWDDIFTREHSRRLFTNIDETRIVVKKKDDSAITDEDVKRLNSIKHVLYTDRYDFANDINYYITEGVDYDYVYQEIDDSQTKDNSVSIDFLHRRNFMRSSSCLETSDLAAGRLPESRNEIVLYSKDQSILGSEKICYFDFMALWGYNEYYTTTVKVVGLLKQESNQVYFSDELCQMISFGLYDVSFQLHASKNPILNKFMVEHWIIPVIGDNLKKGEIRVSRDLADAQVVGEALIDAYIDGEYKALQAKIIDDYNSSTAAIAEISSDWFYELNQQDSNQASLYMKDYVYTNYVLKKARSMGYEAISPFRVSSGAYVYELKQDRMITILTSLFILVMLAILEVLLIKAIMKIRSKDFSVLGSIGMNYKTVKLINYFEMYLYALVSIMLVIMAVNLTGMLGQPYITNMIKYFNKLTYSIFIGFNIFIITLTIRLFNRYLKHKQKWSNYDKNK